MKICSGCGKLIDSKFYYCPWCGYSRLEEENADSEKLRYNQFKQKHEASRALRIEKMKKDLDQLEEELSVMVSSAQLAR